MPAVRTARDFSVNLRQDVMHCCGWYYQKRAVLKLDKYFVETFGKEVSHEFRHQDRYHDRKAEGYVFWCICVSVSSLTSSRKQMRVPLVDSMRITVRDLIVCDGISKYGRNRVHTLSFA